MVLVDEAVRGRGVGTALMRHALAFLDGRGVRSVRLDATPLGRPIYEKLGFVAEYELARYAGLLPTASGALGVESISELLPIFRLDAEVTRTDRNSLLSRMYGENNGAFRVVRRDGEMIAYLASRPGANAMQIGPCAAKEKAAGRLLLTDACARLGGQRVFIDVPLPNRAAVAAVEEMGLTVQRCLLRMGRGEPVRENLPMALGQFGTGEGLT